MTTDASIDRDAPYRDAELPIDERVEDLLARMMPEEKLAQLGSAWVFQLVSGDEVDDERAAPLLCRHGLGHVTRMSGASTLTADKAAYVANEMQRRLVEGTRLGIPAIVHEEICSGLMAREATVFPQAIGVASTFRAGAERRDGRRGSGSRCGRSGAHQGLSPVLDIVPRPALGPARGDLRRGSVSRRRAWGRLSSSGLQGAGSGRRASSPRPSTSSATARRRAA